MGLSTEWKPLIDLANGEDEGENIRTESCHSIIWPMRVVSTRICLLIDFKSHNTIAVYTILCKYTKGPEALGFDGDVRFAISKG